MVSVVVPAYNEEMAISDTVSSIQSVLSGNNETDFEIIVVDDGSTDSTGELARKAGAKVVQNIQNLGYGYSIKRGIHAAQYDTIIITDADGTYPIDRIPDLLQRYRQGYDMVVGARTGSHFRESAIKWPLRQIFRILVEFTAGRRIPDINSGLRIFSKTQALPFFEFTSDTFSFTTSITLGYMLKKKTVVYEEISYSKRIGESKVALFKDSLRALQYIVRAILFYNPIKLFLVICGFVLIFDIALVAVGLALNSTLSLWLGIAGFLLIPIIFSVGLLAELLSNLLSQLCSITQPQLTEDSPPDHRSAKVSRPKAASRKS